MSTELRWIAGSNPMLHRTWFPCSAAVFTLAGWHRLLATLIKEMPVLPLVAARHDPRCGFRGTPLVWACGRPVAGADRLPSSGALREVRVVLEPQLNQGVGLDGDDCGASEMLDSVVFRDLMVGRVSPRTSVGCQVSDANPQAGAEKKCVMKARGGRNGGWGSGLTAC